MANKSSSKGRQAQYSNYKTQERWKTNRRRRLLKAQKQQPENEEIKHALLNLKYRRRKPGAMGWSHTNKHMAQLIKAVHGVCPVTVFSSNTKLADQTIATLAHKPSNIPARQKVSFKLGDRAKIGSWNFGE